MNDHHNPHNESRTHVSDEEPTHDVDEAESFDSLLAIVIVAIAALLAACWWLLPGGKV